jgi:hypothetical protein
VRDGTEIVREPLPDVEVIDEALVRQLAAGALQHGARGRIARLEERGPAERRIEEATRRLHVGLGRRAIGAFDFDIEIIRERHLDGFLEAEAPLRDAHPDSGRGRGVGERAHFRLLLWRFLVLSEQSGHTDNE